LSDTEKIIIQGQTNRASVYLIADFQKWHKFYKNKNAVIITDENVENLYKKLFPALPVITIKAGEDAKTLQTVEKIYEQLIKHNIDRHSIIIGIGGGIVCDITGFAASTYLRGIKFGFVPTTLLAQVDASIGGKNGVNFQGYKNMVGTFNQPDFVLIDYSFLKTLPEKEILCGFGEIIKHGIIKDKELFNYISNNHNEILALNKEAVNKIVSTSLKIKSEVVIEDEKEKGIRKILNFGHTIAHGIEKIDNKYSHGEAVALGIIAASYISMRLKMLQEEDFLQIMDGIKKLRLPNSYDFANKELLKAIEKDKKKDKNSIEFVLIKHIGKSVIKKLNIRELKGHLNAMR
jgi:3-dehydroquinate synthase